MPTNAQTFWIKIMLVKSRKKLIPFNIWIAIDIFNHQGFC